ncbi:uncharacterized protein LOC128594832 isoform X2 [Nycticebus coucang]|uniref:uncharacterized protein LOC128594832 isoform X2 n=1 Tax=Nycticebus coucang TaxID=9470 RepID=UPI00234DD7DC|nr:uncharacterized protein LOC128594832 isoform X2 [Nycticebus coucang]
MLALGRYSSLRFSRLWIPEHWTRRSGPSGSHSFLCRPSVLQSSPSAPCPAPGLYPQLQVALAPPACCSHCSVPFQRISGGFNEEVVQPSHLEKRVGELQTCSSQAG